MADDDETYVPEYESTDVGDYVEAKWRTAVAAARELVESLRDVTPELSGHLPETASHGIDAALGDAERAYSRLHGVGRLVIGSDSYAEFVQLQTKRKIR